PRPSEAPGAPPPALPSLRVAAGRGVGPVRAARLAGAGISTAGALAAEPADQLAATLRDLSGPQAGRLVASARALLATGYRVRWAQQAANGHGGPRVTALGGTGPGGAPGRLPLCAASGRLAARRPRP